MVGIAFLLAVLPGPISWDKPATQLGRLLPELGKAVGESWKSSEALANEVALVHVKDVDAAKLKAQIAKTLDAEWEADQGSSVLVRRKRLVDGGDGYDAKEGARHLLATSEKALKKEVSVKTASAALKAFNDSLTNSEEAKWSTQKSLEMLSPQTRLIMRIVSQIDEKTLVKALQGNRAVFSEHPNKVQLALPDQWRKAVDEFEKESEVWVTALNAEPISSGVGMTASMPARKKVLDFEGMRIELLRNTDSSAVLVNLLAVRSDWPRKERMTQGQVWDDPAAAGWTAYTESLKADSPTIELSKESMEEAEIATLFMGPPRTVSAAAIERMRDPVAHDPLSGFVSDVLSKWADIKETQLVMHVPDAIWTLAAYLGEAKKIKVAQVEAGLRFDFYNLKVVSEDGWTTIGRRSGSSGWADRSAARDLFDRCLKDRKVVLDDQASLHAFQVTKRAAWPGLFLTCIMQNAKLPESTSSDDALLLWGVLKDSQRDLHRRREKLYYSALLPEQKALFAKMAYARMCANEVYGEEEYTIRGGSTPADPTDICPNGVPDSAFVTLDQKEFKRVAVYAGKPEDPMLVRTFDRATAGRMMQGDVQQRAQWLGGRVDLLGFSVANEHVADLRITLTEGAWHEYRLPDGMDAPTEKPMAWDKLPEDVRKGG